jgi:hypothetical protein
MHSWLPILLTRLLSILQASTLRDRYYTAVNRIEILETALDDIQRISQSRASVSERHRLIIGIVENTQKITRDQPVNTVCTPHTSAPRSGSPPDCG